MDIMNQHLKELVMFDKIYKDEDKFSGTGDNFNFNLQSFIISVDKLDCY